MESFITEEFLKNKYGKLYQQKYTFLDRFGRPTPKELEKRYRELETSIARNPSLIFRTENPETINSFLQTFNVNKRYDRETLREFQEEKEKYLRNADPQQHLLNLLDMKPHQLFSYCRGNDDTICQQKEGFFRDEYLMEHFHGLPIEDVFTLQDILEMDDLFNKNAYLELVIVYLAGLGIDVDKVRIYKYYGERSRTEPVEIIYLTDSLNKAALLKFIREYKRDLPVIMRMFRQQAMELNKTKDVVMAPSVKRSIEIETDESSNDEDDVYTAESDEYTEDTEYSEEEEEEFVEEIPVMDVMEVTIRDYQKNFILFLDIIKRHYSRFMDSSNIKFLDTYEDVEIYDLETAIEEYFPNEVEKYLPADYSI